MSFEFYDNFMVLNGKANFDICSRCGAAIKHSYIFRGKIYGSECINKVSGRSVNGWVVRDGVIDEAATESRDKEQLEKQHRIDELASINAKKALDKATRCQSENSWLIAVLATQPGQFCSDVAKQLETTLLDEFSDRQLNIMADIFGKFHGRYNSKKYNAAIDLFWDKFDHNKN
jgi:hypothetical protein